MLREEQIDLRRQRAKAGGFVIENVGPRRLFSDYAVTNPASGGRYTVTVRGFDVGDNSCTCPDFKANTLGTCKHIEAVLTSVAAALPAPVKRKKAPVTRPEVYLHYGRSLTLGVHLPARCSDKLNKLAATFFDDRGLWSGRCPFAAFVPAVEAVPEEVTVLSDALDFIGREVERADLLAREAEWVKQLDAGTLDLNLLPVPLYDYQVRGALFLACRGRSILGDDMGLGKTVQTLAAVELLARERGVGRVLVVAPASVKYQWESEIRRFTGRAVQVIDGTPAERDRQYAEATFYRLVNYEQVVRDRDALNAWGPDVVVLDEAQRIKNWEAKTSQAVKKLQSRYAMVLTGTPLENKLEELYSIVQFVDERRFGPAFQFLHDHRLTDPDGNLTGYRNLDRIREQLDPIFLRRTRGEVLTQLPPRTDRTVTVDLSAAQHDLYDRQRSALARLLKKGRLSDADRKQVLACLTNLRMICDSPYLLDHVTTESPKLAEFAELVPELTGGGHKAVVFSQWEVMVGQAAVVLGAAGVRSATLHGGLSGRERQAVLHAFQTDPACGVLLSTDAGGVGLNLQVADTVVNLELPWNPAVLDQRVARVHRLGQTNPVRVVTFVTRGTIEERVQRANEAKRALFAGVFAGDDDEIAFAAAGRPPFLDGLRDLLGESPPAAPAPAPPPPAAGFGPGPVWLAVAEVIGGLAKVVEAGDPGAADRAVLTAAVERLARAVGRTGPGT